MKTKTKIFFFSFIITLNFLYAHVDSEFNQYEIQEQCNIQLDSKKPDINKLQICESTLSIAKDISTKEGLILTKFGGSPVHENLTILSISLSGILDNLDQNTQESINILFRQGVVWNDDPTVLLWRDPKDHTANSFEGRWLALFGIAKFRSSFNYFYSNTDNLLGRSHFGDLQFLHSMASKTCEEASSTHAKVMMWSEFTYKVATGRIKRETKLKDITIKGFKALFSGSQYYNETIDILFKRDNVREMALGSLLHLIQDSYFDGHTARKSNKNIFSKGMIKGFHSYSGQNSNHKRDDAWPNGLIVDNINGTKLITHDNPKEVLALNDKKNWFLLKNYG